MDIWELVIANFLGFGFLLNGEINEKKFEHFF